MESIDDAVLEDLYSWIDKIPLSRKKQDIRRDFADGSKWSMLQAYYIIVIH